MAVNMGDFGGVITTTGSGVAFAATCNHNDGIIVTNGTPTSSSTVTFTITCAPATAVSIVQVEVLGNSAAVGSTNTTQGLYVNEVTAAAGSFTVNVKTPAALNGTIALGFSIS